MIRALVDIVFPPRCPLCGDGVARHGGLCASCWSGLQRPGEPACAACSRTLGTGAAADGESLCAPCLIAPPRHAGIHAATLYNRASRHLVLGLKRGRRLSHAGVMARLMAESLQGLEGDWLIVPVPLHRGRLWSRSFNQSALLARELRRLIRQPLAVDALHRRRRTPSLGGLDRAARRRALAGAIRLTPRWREAVHGAQVLLVDDVLTSGATSDACVAVLRKGGALAVRIACFSRVLDEALDHDRDFDPAALS